MDTRHTHTPLARLSLPTPEGGGFSAVSVRTFPLLSREMSRVAGRENAQTSEWALGALKNLGSLRPLDGESLGGLLIRTLEAKIPIRGARECWRIESTETIDDLHPQSKQGELLLQLIQATPVYLACPGLEARCDALHPELLTALFAQLGEQEHFRVWTPYDAFDHIKRIYWDYCDSDTERKEQMRRQLHLERGVEPSDAEVLEVMKEEWGDIPTLSEVLEELGERYVRPSTLESNQARELCAQDKHLKHIWSLGEQLKSIPLPPYSCGYTPCTLLLDPHPELERNSECFDEAHRWVMEDCDSVGGGVIGLSSPHLKAELAALQKARALWEDLLKALSCFESASPQEENPVNPALESPRTPEPNSPETDSSAARIEMDLPLGESAPLTEAWLLYQTPNGGLQDVRRFKVVHDPEGPRLGVGLALTRSGLEQALESLAPRSFALLPPEVLAYNGHRMVFYVPPGKRSMHFETGDAALRKISGQSFPQPGLIFDVKASSVRITAFKGRTRPTAQTPLFHAPYYNIFDDDGVCWGSTGRPLQQLDPEGWAAAYFASSFTHASGQAKRSKFPGSHFELWAAAGVAGSFSPKWLVQHPRALTLEAWLQQDSRFSRG